jgi:phosphoribosyl-AMP cyclohydrolase
MNLIEIKKILKTIKFNEIGLMPAVTQDIKNKKVLMLAWMNADSISKTLETKEVHYWSRSRQQLWKKGETSGNLQFLKEFHLDCDNDSILLTVEQIGPACHTKAESCFFKKIDLY